MILKYICFKCKGREHRPRSPRLKYKVKLHGLLLYNRHFWYRDFFGATKQYKSRNPGQGRCVEAPTLYTNPYLYVQKKSNLKRN